MSTAWDCIEKRHTEVGARRWLTIWHTEKPDAPRDPDGFLEDEIDGHSRAFPARGKGLAVAFARQILTSRTDYFGCPTVQQEEFSREGFDGSAYGCWEMVGHAFEVWEA